MSLKTLIIRYTVFIFTVLAASISSVILIKLILNSFSLRKYMSTLKLNFLTNFTAIEPEECLKTTPFISGIFFLDFRIKMMNFHIFALALSLKTSFSKV